MLVLALLFAGTIALPEFVELGESGEAALDAIGWLIYGIFAVEIGARIYLAPNRFSYAAAHWFDLLILAIPLLRPLRAARSLRALRLLRGLQLLGPLARSASEIRRLLAYKGVTGGLLVATLAVMVCSAAIWRVEADSNGPIHDLPDAPWWALTTITTVGYGDTYPVTPEGRAIGVVLMLVGIGVFGTLTASVAAFFIETSDEQELTEIRESLRRIEARLNGPTR
jgi:voltage-gated potassium channel